MSTLTVSHAEIVSMSKTFDSNDDFLIDYLDFTTDTISSGTYKNNPDGSRLFSLKGCEVATFFHDDNTIEYSFDADNEPFYLAAFIAKHVYTDGIFTEYHVDRLSENFRGI